MLFLARAGNVWKTLGVMRLTSRFTAFISRGLLCLLLFSSLQSATKEEETLRGKPWERHELLPGQSIGGVITVVDLNQDSLPDVITSEGSSVNWVIHPGVPNVRTAWSLKTIFEKLQTDVLQSLNSGDVDGDEAVDLILSGKNGLQILWSPGKDALKGSQGEPWSLDAYLLEKGRLFYVGAVIPNRKGSRILFGSEQGTGLALHRTGKVTHQPHLPAPAPYHPRDFKAWERYTFPGIGKVKQIRAVEFKGALRLVLAGSGLFWTEYPTQSPEKLRNAAKGSEKGGLPTARSLFAPGEELSGMDATLSGEKGMLIAASLSEGDNEGLYLISSKDGEVWDSGALFLPDAVSRPRDCRLVDMNLDGDMDVMAIHGDQGRVFWIKNPGKPSLPWNSFRITDHEQKPVTAMSPVDLDYDGDTDLVVIEGDRLAWYENPMRGGIR